MPLFEYECLGCASEYEILQRSRREEPAPCKACGGALTRKMSLSSFHLKGSGWYTTDYAKPSGGATQEPPACAATCATGKCGVGA